MVDTPKSLGASKQSGMSKQTELERSDTFSSDRATRAMTPSQFREWRKRHNLKQREIADLLGLKKRIIQYYERGERDGKKLEIPLNIRLACYAIDRGIVDFDGTLVEKKKIGGTTRKA